MGIFGRYHCPALYMTDPDVQFCPIGKIFLGTAAFCLDSDTFLLYFHTQF